MDLIGRRMIGVVKQGLDNRPTLDGERETVRTASPFDLVQAICEV